jgi:hypothetical protein
VADIPHLGLDYALLWWLMLEGIGLIALPLTFRLFRHLPDRGYTFAKPLGLIVVTYLLWMLSTLGLLRNSWSNVLLVLVLALVLSGWLYRRAHERGELVRWLRDHRWTVVASEVVLAWSTTWCTRSPRAEACSGRRGWRRRTRCSQRS